MGRPVPVPPQLLHAIRPDPAQVPHPWSPSDQRVHMQETRPVPLQLGHLVARPEPIIGFSSITCFTITAPAKTLRPVANWVKTRGPMFRLCAALCSRLIPEETYQNDEVMELEVGDFFLVGKGEIGDFFFRDLGLYGEECRPMVKWWRRSTRKWKKALVVLGCCLVGNLWRLVKKISRTAILFASIFFDFWLCDI